MSKNVPGGFEEYQHVGINGEDEKEVRDGIDELKIVGDTDRRTTYLVQHQVEIHRPHSKPQPQPHVVRWEKFLPLRSLKVLLVENDDSTRHIVSALLRNCSYEVTPLSNCVEAWKILIELDNQIDLVLTEVVMPGVSGIGLLSKIMSHKSCQNIPVIMMSSHDSMGIVVKCLSKGAADFLVKPIRKNELKNLWQHVWRRCHSSSGSGSESGIRTEKSAGAKNAEQSNNDTGSNADADADDDHDDDENDDDTRSIDLLVRDGSDNGSGTQSSWTKRAAEAESPQPTSSWDRLADPPNSTCAQVIYPRSEAFASSWLPTPMKENGGQDDQRGDIAMGKDLEIGIPRNSDSQINGPSKTVTTSTSAETKINGRNVDKGKLGISCEITKGERIKQAAHKAGDVVGNEEHCRGSTGSKIPTILVEVSKGKDKVTENCKDLPSLELSLKRMGDVAGTSTDSPEQNILGHSEISAFTRYNTGSTASQGQTGIVGSCSPLDNTSDAVKQYNSRSLPNQTSDSSSNNNDMGSTTNRSSTKPTVATTDKMPVNTTVNCSNHSSAFQPVPNPQLMVSGKGCGVEVNVVPSLENGMGEQTQIQHHHHYHHHHHHHVHNVQQDSNGNDLSPQNMDEIAPLCGSSNHGRVVNEANAANCSLNGSASGSNHGSNLHNGNSAAVNAELMNMVSDNGAATRDRVDNGSGSGSGSGVDQNRSAQREAALNKFRLKRKERCFEKRVRYQSRKKLAEQRPRVRGQFVRQVREAEGNDDDS